MWTGDGDSLSQILVQEPRQQGRPGTKYKECLEEGDQSVEAESTGLCLGLGWGDC